MMQEVVPVLLGILDKLEKDGLLDEEQEGEYHRFETLWTKGRWNDEETKWLLWMAHQIMEEQIEKKDNEGATCTK